LDTASLIAGGVSPSLGGDFASTDGAWNKKTKTAIAASGYKKILFMLPNLSST
jgi:hypothetical protein